MDEVILGPKEAYSIADSFALASSLVLEVRLANNQHLSDSEATELERCEDSLDSLVVLYRGYGIKLIGQGAQQAAASIKQHVDDARFFLKKIQDMKAAIVMAGALVDFAIAIYKGDTDTVFAAANKLTKSKNDAEPHQLEDAP